MTLSPAVERSSCTANQREYRHTVTSQYFPSAMGPKKSLATVCHGPSGFLVGFNGSYDWEGSLGKTRMT